VDLVEYVRQHATTTVSTVAQLWQFFHAASKETIAGLRQANAMMFYGSVGAGEVLYIPLGSVVSEAVGPHAISRKGSA
jgi:hypothetical protein